MRTNIFLTTIAAVAAMVSLASCEKDNIFTVETRTPSRVEFSQRQLPAGFTIGANKPAEAQAIDLGLSVKWANMDLGASSPSQPGALYAWGEITPSGNYGWSSYEFNDFHPEDERSLYLTKYCFDKYGEKQDIAEGGMGLDRYDDAAYIAWGDGWRMPTVDEFKELMDKCTWTPDALTKTITVTGPNGNSIIISFGSCRVGIGSDSFLYKSDGFSHAAVNTGYWTSTLDTYNSFDAKDASINILNDDKPEIVKVEKTISRMNRCFGLSIRPVSEN